MTQPKQAFQELSVLGEGSWIVGNNDSGIHHQDFTCHLHVHIAAPRARTHEKYPRYNAPAINIHKLTHTQKNAKTKKMLRQGCSAECLEISTFFNASGNFNDLYKVTNLKMLIAKNNSFR